MLPEPVLLPYADFLSYYGTTVPVPDDIFYIVPLSSFAFLSFALSLIRRINRQKCWIFYSLRLIPIIFCILIVFKFVLMIIIKVFRIVIIIYIIIVFPIRLTVISSITYKIPYFSRQQLKRMIQIQPPEPPIPAGILQSFLSICPSDQVVFHTGA